MIARTAQQMHRLPTWAFLIMVTIALTMGMIFITGNAAAQMYFGGRVVGYVSGPPPGGPCPYGMGIIIAGLQPSIPPCILWLAGPIPPIGASVMGFGSLSAIIFGGFGL